MNIAIIGGAGFIGVNLAIRLSSFPDNRITVVDRDESFFEPLRKLNLSNVAFLVGSFDNDTDFDRQVKGQDVIYHLASTTIPGTSNQHIPEELDSNVTVTARLFDACVKQKVKKVIFISSGGTVYGKKGKCPIEENMVTYPISSYGIQKLAIEKMLYLYRYQFGLDYRIIRLANPYGPYQRPNGRLGVVTTFIYKAMTDGRLEVYGDGTVVRDFIYIDDAVKGIINIADGDCEYRVFNLGSGKGTSVNQVIDSIKKIVRDDICVEYESSRSGDVPENYLDISRYEKYYGKLDPMSLEEGIKRTMDFLKEYNG
ncbi:MAG: UDP-glucose 4-epimerase [Firmicutes bacterium ADurb.Bin354]|nr:MAG: UDP-glucose 4-epimerase [Firmicutes bacterium ADurb.Bin354]SCY41073.1 UDP-glucose 4-epimerase [Lachnospiraceae bacterium XPB1003]